MKVQTNLKGQPFILDVQDIDTISKIKDKWLALQRSVYLCDMRDSIQNTFWQIERMAKDYKKSSKNKTFKLFDIFYPVIIEILILIILELFIIIPAWSSNNLDIVFKPLLDFDISVTAATLLTSCSINLGNALSSSNYLKELNSKAKNGDIISKAAIELATGKLLYSNSGDIHRYSNFPYYNEYSNITRELYKLDSILDCGFHRQFNNISINDRDTAATIILYVIQGKSVQDALLAASKIKRANQILEREQRADEIESRIRNQQREVTLHQQQVADHLASIEAELKEERFQRELDRIIPERRNWYRR